MSPPDPLEGDEPDSPSDRTAKPRAERPPDSFSEQPSNNEPSPDFRHSPGSQRWILLGGLWVVYFSFGLIVTSLAPLLTPVSAELELSKSSLGAILGAWPLVFIIASLPCGWLLDRIGLRWALFLGTALMCLSGVLRAMANDGVDLFIAVGVFGLGAPLVSNGAPKLVVTHFPERERALATGLYLTGPMGGQIVALALANSVILPLVGGTWRGVVFVLAAATAGSGLLWLTFPNRNSAGGEGADGTAEAPGGTEVMAGSGETDAARGTNAAAMDGKTDATGTEAAETGEGALDRSSGAETQGAAPPRRSPSMTLMRERSMQLVLLLAVSVFFVNHGLNNWMPKILEDGGVSASAAGFITAVSYGAGAAGSLLLPHLGKDSNRIWLPVVTSLCLAATVAMLAVISGMAAAPFVALVGFFRFGLVGLSLMVLMRVPGTDSRNMGVASGLFFSAGEIGGFTGPLTVGAIADAGGGFSASLLTLTAATLLQTYLLILIFRRSARIQGLRGMPSGLPPEPPGRMV